MPKTTITFDTIATQKAFTEWFTKEGFKKFAFNSNNFKGIDTAKELMVVHGDITEMKVFNVGTRGKVRK